MNDQNDPNQPGTQTPPPTAAIPPTPVATTPTFPQTTAELPPIQQGETTPPSGNLSPLDNPWKVPAQPPPIDSGITPPSTFPPTPTDLSILTSTPQAVPQTIVSESAPTDLSHLIGNSQPEGNSLQQSTLETLVAPPTNTSPDVPTTPPVEHKGIPKWLIGVGIGLFLLVVGASAYFILGIGRAPDTTSIPATQAPKTTQQIKPPAPLPTPVSKPVATGSASFGELQGGGALPQQATSAADLLRQRQGR